MKDSQRPQDDASDGNPALLLLLIAAGAGLGYYALHGVIEALQGWAMLFQLPMF